LISFGPIPSRRLGRSLGINNIPPKICTYSCSYCQQGFSQKMFAERKAFYDPQVIFSEVTAKVNQTLKAGETIDYLAFVPDGEPTLDINLGTEIKLLKPLGIKIAVITNATLLDQQDVRAELNQADWVSVKVDAVDEQTWRHIDHPLRSLSLEIIMESILTFSREFPGKLVTETMLVKGLNDSSDCLERIANFIHQIKPETAYITIPSRPPADKSVSPPDEYNINVAFQIFTAYLDKVECLTGYEGNTFTYTGNIAEDILAITSVHPMRHDAIQSILHRAGEDWSIIDKLISEDKLFKITFQDHDFYMRKLFKGYGR